MSVQRSTRKRTRHHAQYKAREALQHTRPGRIGSWVISAGLAVAPIAASGSAFATTDNWQCIGTHNWSNGACWSTTTPPGSHDTAHLEGAIIPGSATIDLDAGHNVHVVSVTVDNTSSRTTTLNMNNHITFTATNEYIGGRGVFNQSAGINTTDLLWPQRGGQYNLFDGTVNANTVQLDGTIRQSGGGMAVAGTLLAGQNSTGDGVLLHTGGDLTASQLSLVGANTFFDLSGGTVTASTLYMSDGFFRNQGAGLNITNQIQQFGGSFDWLSGPVVTPSYLLSGGSLTSGSTMRLDSTGVAALTLSGSGQLQAAGLVVGDGGTATMIQGGGTANITNYGLILGAQAGSSGTYQYNAGLLTVKGATVIGAAGAGDFFQGSAATFNDGITLGDSATGNGTYTTGFGATLQTSSLVVGNYGTGTFNQTAGSNVTVASGLTLGANGGAGTYSVAGGTLTADTVTMGAGSSFTIGDLGMVVARQFNQNGGHFTSLMDLNIDSGGIQNYVLNNGSLTTYPTYYISRGGFVGGNEFIGYTGTGHFTQNGGTNDVVGTLFGDGSVYLGYNTGAFGQYTMTGGALNAMNLTLGVFGRGTMTQSGGAVTIANDVILANNAGGTGTYTLDGGATLSANYIATGYGGVGLFNLLNGTVTANNLTIGGVAGSHGLWSQPQGSLHVGDLYVGYGGTGNFVSGGDVVVDRTMAFAVLPGSIGTGIVTRGTLTADAITLGASSAFSQVGGTVSARTIDIAAGAMFTQGGGTLNATITNNGSLTYSGGTFNGTINNNGAVSVTSSLLTVSTFTNNGSAFVNAAPGATLAITGNLLGNTTNNTLWNTTAATLAFFAGAGNNHLLELSGIEVGRSGLGMTNNFGWGTLEIGAGQTLTLTDDLPNWQAVSGALYISTLELDGYTSGDLAAYIASLFQGAFNIYYDAQAMGNDYLHGLTYAFSGGGALIGYNEVTSIAPVSGNPGDVPVPEPGSVLLLLPAIGGLMAARRRPVSGN